MGEFSPRRLLAEEKGNRPFDLCFRAFGGGMVSRETTSRPKNLEPFLSKWQRQGSRSNKFVDFSGATEEHL